jgi:uncharacterized protein YecE (DUF72 family)
MSGQTSLFDPMPVPSPEQPGPEGPASGRVGAAPVSEDWRDLAERLRARWGDRLHLGTSSWHFPGWAGLVYDRTAPAPWLSRHGLAPYAKHPLLRTVSLDRTFYRPASPSTLAALAAQVPKGFRFVVKAPALVTDASVREAGQGRPSCANPGFLDPDTTLAAAVQPALEGLGESLGVLVFQLSPLPPAWVLDHAQLHERLERLWSAVVPALPEGVTAGLELRDPALLTPRMAAQLKAHRVRYVLGLHDRMPGAEAQLDMLRATWPGDFVCRWNLQRGLAYQQAYDRFAPFDRLQAPDPGTRAAVARVVAATLDAGHRAFVTINNKAEGSAPLSVVELARVLAA